jgi:multidrug resistance efflux pump
MRLQAFSNRLLKPLALFGLALPFLIGITSCTRSQTGSSSESYGIIVVNAPAAGVVRRVLVSEGAQVNADTPIVEIVVQEQLPAAAAPEASPGESAEAQAVRRVRASGAEIDAARAEVVRHEAEVLRLTPLVASGEVSQAQLDGERALYEQAQQRLQKAQDAEKQAQTGLLAARQPGAAAAPQTSASGQPPVLREQTVVAKTSSAGTVTVISVRPGERVQSGQPLCTLRSDAR